MSLEFTLVRRAISLAVIDGPDADDNPDILQAQGSVLFEPVIKKGDSIQVQTRGGSETYALAPIECPINDGIISHRGQDGVKLPAGGEAANPSLIRWKATFSRMQAGGKSFTLAPVIFDAVPGGEIDLTMVAPVAGAPEGVVRGPRGTSLESIIVDGSELVFTAVDDAGSFEIARIPLDEMVRAEAEAAADGVRDALAVDVAASQSARDAAEGHANRAATSESNAKTSETNAKQSETNAGDYAAVATTAATEAVDAMDSVSDIIGANYATREYVDGKAWQKGLLYTTSLDEVLTPGVYAQPNSNWATSANGYPEQTRGTLTVSSWDTRDPGRVYQVFTATYFNRVWMRERVSGAWAKWFNFHSASFQVNGDLNYQDLNNVLSPGVYRQPLSARATAARNYPQTTRGILTVHQWGDESQVSQTYQATFRGDVYTREHSATGWESWMRIAGDTSTSSNGSQLNHRRDAMKQASRMRRGGVIGTNGATPVSLSFDHGYVKFRDKVLPHLRRLGLPCTSAFNQGQFEVGENEGISWPQLQEFGLNYGVEFAHHGYSHTDISDASTNVERITNALTSSIDLVKTQMPEVVADAFILPGVGGTNYDGFNGGADPESWWAHPAGRVLMQHFPVVSAKRRGVAVPLMQGEDLSFGSDRLGWDTADGADALKSHIQSLSGTTLGVKCFMHPSQIGLAGKISEAKLVETLEWLAAERDAGRIEVLTVSGFAHADVTSNVRMNLTPSWIGDQAVISLSPMMDYLAGAQVLVETTAETSGPLTISATSDTGGLDAAVTHTATAGRRYRLAFSIPKSAKTITITAPGNLRSARIV